MMMRGLGLAMMAATAQAGFVAPWFCHGINCPEFTEGKNITVGGTALEVRRYTAGQLWTSTDFSEMDIKKAGSAGFQRLFDYISGDNVDKKKVDMTSPVRTIVKGSGDMTVSFYVPWAYQPALTSGAPQPPAPSQSNCYTSNDEDEVVVAVYQYGGFVTDANAQQHKDELVKMLTTANVDFVSDSWMVSQYDPPFRLIGRHNEIWVQLKNY